MITRLLSRLFIFLIQGIRPLLGGQGCCKYSVTCTQFAINQLKERPLHRALWHICKRVLSCNPFTKPIE
jgi:putative component of membrane protein insertase Oxa1/YidC/SpoIIIJ protein YidD